MPWILFLWINAVDCTFVVFLHSNALESISTQHQTDLQLARDQACEEVATQAGRDAEKTQQEMDRLSKQVEERDAVSA